jgi:hypothetical protein
MREAGGRGLGFNDDISDSNRNSALRMMLAAGTYRLYANAASAQTGDYSISSQIGPANVTNCAEVWIMPGLQTAGQTVATTDCLTTNGYYFDEYYIWLTAGARITVSHGSTEFDAFLLIRDESDNTLAEDDDSGGGPNGTNSRLTFTAPAEGVYRIWASTYNPGLTGAYPLVVQSP